ncbi:WYL domain-containing protein [Streptomyces sp. MST-110588]|uniref:helix-turn-helix transcriptional regulator n=1 Tax=Streptomyces sp. MST-110588 TaxID=2833628 RepID=UPI001F5D20AE|nr:WYL domain-containing protein [Streptomyces sp. MST-110588]UNO39221.1 WYL domain-containing protein [Streptomyces sp. MST-110588]
MRADRLLTLLLLLQNRGRMTAPELAAELEVSVRTVYRDIEALGAAGVPVLADRGPLGGYRLTDGYRTRLTGLTDAEAGSLFLAGVPGPAAELGLGAELATARLKMTAALPPGPGERARRVQERFHLDASGWFRQADPVPHLAQVAEAVWEQRTLRVRYRRWGGEVRRELRPLGLVLKSGIWYVVARAPEAAGTDTDTGTDTGGGTGTDTGTGPGTIRTYRVSRFLELEITQETFERPAGFDLAAYWSRSARQLEDRLYPWVARIRASPQALRLLPMRFGGPGARAAADAGPPDAEGWREVELPVETTAVAVGDLLRMGTDAEVLDPPELRKAVAAAVASLARRYGTETDCSNGSA